MTIELFRGTGESAHLWFGRVQEDGRTVYLGPAYSTFRMSWNDAARWVNEELNRREQ